MVLDSILWVQIIIMILFTAMKERQQEISMHKEMLFSQLKAAEEERQTVSAELHMRTEKIDKLRKR